MITFENGKSYDPIVVLGGTMHHQGAQRDTIEIRIPEASADFEELKTIYTDSGATVGITNTIGDKQFYYANYTIPVELSFKPIDGTNVYCMKLAQRSSLEIAQEKQAAELEITQAALAEVIEMTMGGETE